MNVNEILIRSDQLTTAAPQLHNQHILRADGTYDGDVDLITGAERRLAGYRDGGVGGQILDDVETPEHTTNLLHRHTL